MALSAEPAAARQGSRSEQRVQKGVKAQPALQIGDLCARVDTHSLLTSEAAWVPWWDEYESRVAAHNVPKSAYPVKWMRDYYNQIVAQLRAVAPFLDIPRTTGALETLIGGDIKQTLSHRGSGFGNLVRTNQLAELLTLGATGCFSELARVAEVLRRDALLGVPDNPGFVPPVRQILDHGTERSLLDRARLERLAREAVAR